MCVLVWGFGNYYKKKEKNISKGDIIRFVSAKEKGQFQGINIIAPSELCQYEHSKLYLMVGPGVFFEVLKELQTINYREWDKIVLGWNVEPYTEEEALLLADGEFRIDSEGRCNYCSLEGKVELRNGEDWIRLKQWRIRSKNKNELMEIARKPISSLFGFDRGLPIDRYYIEKFLEQNSSFIRGTVFEVADREYTVKYGKNVKESITTHVCGPFDSNGRLVNLETGEGVTEGMADCFILTQTLPFIFDVRTAAQNVVRILKNGGIALITVAGITQISRYDMDRWGHYWSFTTASLKRLFVECKDVEYVEVHAYGNVKTAVSGLYGLAAEEMTLEDLAYQDDDYQQVITAVVRKKDTFV